jgi:site-specific DNA-adenine methylase
LKKIFQDHPDEILKIYNLLLNFPDEINNTKKELAKNAESKRNIYDENRINYAIGAVIDDVRDAFSTVSNNENIDNIN